MELDAAVWGKLPFEMVERVLSFLPVPDLCRLRTVSKESNGVIRKREFGVTHGHNALRRREASRFIVMRCIHGTVSRYSHQTWCFFDLEARRWYTLKAHHRALVFETPWPQTYWSATAAMDGGLVCQFSKSRAGLSIIVFNPIADTLREIPSLPARADPRYAKLNLVVDSAAKQFKVLLITRRNCETRVEDPLVSIFDSATNEWRSLSNPPGLFSEWEHVSVSIVMFQGLVYAFFSVIPNYAHLSPLIRKIYPTSVLGIWRCSPVENAWERVNVDIYSCIFDNVDKDTSTVEGVHMDRNSIYWLLRAPMLFVSADSLFLMAWITDEGGDSPWILKVSEIRASGLAPRRLFMMSKSDVMDVFAVKCDGEKDFPRILASGCGNSLLLTSTLSRKLIMLDLETLEWEMVLQIPVEASQGTEVCTLHGNFHGKHMNLILPSTLWWQEGQGNAV